MGLDYQKLSKLVYSKTESEVISLIQTEIDKTPKQKHQILNRVDENIDRLIKANDNNVHFEDTINNCNHFFDANIIKEFIKEEQNNITGLNYPKLIYNGNKKELAKAFYELKMLRKTKDGKPVLECNNDNLISLLVNVFGFTPGVAKNYITKPDLLIKTIPAFDTSEMEKDE